MSPTTNMPPSPQPPDMVSTHVRHGHLTPPQLLNTSEPLRMLCCVTLTTHASHRKHRAPLCVLDRHISSTGPLTVCNRLTTCKDYMEALHAGTAPSTQGSTTKAHHCIHPFVEHNLCLLGQEATQLCHSVAAHTAGKVLTSSFQVQWINI